MDTTRFEEYNTPAYQLLGEELVSVRQIPPNRRSVTGLFPSQKGAKMVPFESALERDLAATLEFSETVASYESQPVELRYRSRSGRSCRGYPDFLVTFHAGNGPPMLCDVKYREELFRRWPELKPRLKAARAYAHERGWTYRIKTEVEIRTPFLANARFLLPYTRCTPDPEHALILGDAIRKLQTATPRLLLEACCQDPWNQAQLVPTMWSLVGRRNIGVDLDVPVTMGSTIWYPVAR
ncbi:MAG: TnsA endonuclease N-terminal domain-containing protein [Firmicutes bacterium]|nr:TnsA endonuclease N-terminal domain-containing protein [Bacillota bacterium]